MELLVEWVVDQVGAVEIFLVHVDAHHGAVVVGGVVVFAFFHVAARAVDGVFVFVTIDMGKVLLLANRTQDVEELADAGAIIGSLL